MDVTIKNATINDIVPIFELNKKLINDYETSTNLSFNTIYDWIKHKIQNNIENYQCIYFDEVKVGYFFLRNEGNKLELDDFYIFKNFQNKGIGTKILQYVDSIAKIQNKDVFLYVFSKNKGAINLYLRNGFEITEDIHGSRYVMTKKVVPYN